MQIPYNEQPTQEDQPIEIESEQPGANSGMGLQTKMNRRQFLSSTKDQVLTGLAFVTAANLPVSAPSQKEESLYRETREEEQFADFLESDVLAPEEKAEFLRFKGKCVTLLAQMNKHAEMTQIDVDKLLYYAIVEYRREESEMVGERDGKPIARPVSFPSASRLVIGQVSINGKTNDDLDENGRFPRLRYVVTTKGHAAIMGALGKVGSMDAQAADEFYKLLNETYYKKALPESVGGYYVSVDHTKINVSKLSPEQKDVYKIWLSLNGQPTELLTLMDNTRAEFDPDKIPEGYDKKGFNPKTLFNIGVNFFPKG